VSEFRVSIRTDNAAFEEGDRGAEVARILRDVADRLEDGFEAGSVRDINGNLVGGFDFHADEVMP
jgi:hypothetical protein